MQLVLGTMNSQKVTFHILSFICSLKRFIAKLTFKVALLRFTFIDHHRVHYETKQTLTKLFLTIGEKENVGLLLGLLIRPHSWHWINKLKA